MSSSHLHPSSRQLDPSTTPSLAAATYSDSYSHSNSHQSHLRQSSNDRTNFPPSENTIPVVEITTVSEVSRTTIPLTTAARSRPSSPSSSSFSLSNRFSSPNRSVAGDGRISSNSSSTRSMSEVDWKEMKETEPITKGFDTTQSSHITPSYNLQPRRLSVSNYHLYAKEIENASNPIDQRVRSRQNSFSAASLLRHRSSVPIVGPVSLKDPSLTTGRRAMVEIFQPTDVFCLAYQNGRSDGKSDATTGHNSHSLMVGCGDGSIRVIETMTREQLPSDGQQHFDQYLSHMYRMEKDREHLPVTCIRFNPRKADILLAASADGSLTHWNVSNVKDESSSSECIRTFREPSSSVYAIDYESDGRHYATGGRDHIIRFYDEETDQLVRTCSNIGAHGHSNRVFAVKYHTSEAHLLLSGGWDQTLQLWDDRIGSSVKSIYGPHLCGDSLDLHSNGRHILTGSWREENALQRWDLSTGKLIDTIPWNSTDKGSQLNSESSTSTSNSEPNCMLYAASYSPDERFIAAGGAGNGVNQVKLFDARTGEPVERISFQHGVYALTFEKNGDRLAMGGVDPQVTVVHV